MSAAVIGILLILVGVLAIFLMPKGKAADAPTSTDTASDAKTEASTGDTADNEEEKKKKSEEAAANRSKTLSSLVVPGNLPPLRIWFGSQTGTAEKFATNLDEEAHELGIADSKVIDFNDFKEDEFAQQPLVIVIVATHYEGDPCDNTRKYHKHMKSLLKKKTEKPYSGMNFTIFGLGDTSYELFNEMGKQFDEGFEKLGGKRLHKMEAANAETFSTEDDFNNWKENLWQNIFEHFKASETQEQKSKSLIRRKSLLKVSDPSVLPWIVDISGSQLASADDEAPEYDMNMRNYQSSTPLPIKSIRQLRQKCVDGGSTLEVTYDLRGTGLTYITAANSAIYAINRDEDVQKFAQMFEIDLDTKFTFAKNSAYSGRKAKTPFPIASAEGMTYREALTKHIDLTGAVSKKLLTAMIPFCESQEDKTLLEEVVKKGSTKYDELFQKRCLGMLDIHTIVPSLRLTPTFIFQKCDLIMPRYYTIASSSKAHPEELTIAVSLSRFDVTLPSGKTVRDGLVSGYLEDIFKRQEAGSNKLESTMCFVKSSNFDMPATHDVPMIMVGPGTGVVPFIGFMQEREKATEGGAEVQFGQAHMYFGCRQHDNDFIYRDEMHSMKDKGIISELNLAFSREADAPKTYVQDLLTQQTDLIKQVLLEQNGQFFVCGATTMGKAVEALVKTTVGEEVFKQIQKEKRYKVELWSA